MNERTYRWPRLDLSLLRPLFVQIDVLWPRFSESVVCHFGTQVCCDACLCRSMSTGFGLVLSPAPPLRVEDFGFVTVTAVVSNEEFVFVVQNLKRSFAEPWLRHGDRDGR